MVKSAFLIDDFTSRLLDVIAELTKRHALPRKSEFSKDVLDISLATLNKIESLTRNYPTEKREKAINKLNMVFGVKKSFWLTRQTGKAPIKVTFDFDPPVRRHVKQQMVSYHAYSAVLTELDACKREIGRLNEILAQYPSIAAETHAPYYKSDRNSDQKPPKKQK